MTVEGRLHIALQAKGGSVEKVSIGSSRPLNAATVLHGKSVTQALQILPMLYSICSTAQTCAGVRACEQAQGSPPATGVEILRDCLVHTETVREHLWRILLDWPLLLDEKPDNKTMARALALLRDCRQAITRDLDPFRWPVTVACKTFRGPDNSAKIQQEQIDRLLEQAVFGIPTGTWLELDSIDALAQWAKSSGTQSARLILLILENAWEELGRNRISALPKLDSERLQTAFDDKDFVKVPRWSGDCQETTCQTRTESSLLRQLAERYGNGLIVRLVARLTELLQLTRRLGPEAVTEVTQQDFSPCNPGLGQATAARGQLVHRVELKNEQIVRYQILAPTEWNFHPRGVVARGLTSLHGNKQQIEQQARLFIAAIDPCVDYDLVVA